MGMRRVTAGACSLIVFVALLVVSSAPVAAAPTASGKTGVGYWVVQQDGTVFAFGDAADLRGLTKPPTHGIVGVAAQPGGQGFVLAGSDGGVFTFGRASFYGSMGGTRLQRPVVGIASTPSGRGYFLVASDGGIFAFGDARFRGSLGGRRLNAPIVGIAVTPTGHGYWLVAADGGVFGFGDATFFGSAARLALHAPVAGIAATRNGRGYWLASADGGIFPYGNATFRGSAKDAFGGRAVGIAASPRGAGYLVAFDDGNAIALGDASSCPFSFPFNSDLPSQFVGGTTNTEILLPPNFAGVPLPGVTVGVAIPFDSATLGTFLAGSCGDVSQPFTATAPWHIDVAVTNSFSPYPVGYCQVVLLRANLGGPGELPVLDEIQTEGVSRVEIRSTQMAGNTQFRILAQPSCFAVARPGTGGTQSLPFTTTTGGDSLPFTSASPITINATALQPCQVEVFANTDGHFVDGHFGSHAHLVLPAGSYFLRSDPNCSISVT
jgi:hypothetical protein